MNFIFPFHIYGMSSFPLTNSIISQRGRYTTNQHMFFFGRYTNINQIYHDIAEIYHDIWILTRFQRNSCADSSCSAFSGGI